MILFAGATLAHFVRSLLVVLGASMPGPLFNTVILRSLRSLRCSFDAPSAKASLRSLWPPQALSDAAIKGRVHYPVIFASLRSLRSLRANPKRLADRGCRSRAVSEQLNKKSIT